MIVQDLGLEESNKGVFDGTWKGSGEVTKVDQNVGKNKSRFLNLNFKLKGENQNTGNCLAWHLF